jgi:hypothetical protein
MRRELDIHGLRSQLRTDDRLQELDRHADSLSDELSRRPRLAVQFVDPRCCNAGHVNSGARRRRGRLWSLRLSPAPSTAIAATPALGLADAAAPACRAVRQA